MISIPIKLPETHPSVTFMPMFELNKELPKYTCGGPEILFSKSTGKYFKGCEASSELNPTYDCKAGLSG